MDNENIKEILNYYQKDIDRYEKNMKNYTEYQQKTTFSKNYQRYKNHKLLLDYITNLQEENEKVHKDFDELSERYFFTKSRNEKAIEYVEHHKFNKFGDIDCGEAEEIINILNGGDDNE